MSWQQIRRITERHAKSPTLVSLHAIERDNGLKDDVRKERADPLRQAAQVEYDRARQEAAKLVEDARAAWVEHMPAAIQRNASRHKPEKMAWGQQIGATASAGEMVRAARLIERERDAAGAYGLRLALAQRTDLTDADRLEILRVLDDAGTTGWQSTLADYVAAQTAFAQLEIAGVDGDGTAGTLTDPGAALARHRAAQNIVTSEDGETRTLSETEHAKYLETAGMLPPAA